MEKKIIEYDGKEINLSKLSNEELIELQVKVKYDEKKYKKLMKEYLKKYPFLKDKK